MSTLVICAAVCLLYPVPLIFRDDGDEERLLEFKYLGQTVEVFL